MDSKLVVEQMSGRWKIKHPDMRPLAAEANRLAPFGTTYTWVPREQNEHADRLANEALDGKRDGVTAAGAVVERAADEPVGEEAERPAPARAGARRAAPTTLVLVRHGVTPHTAAKRFSGGLASATPASATRAATRSGPRAEWLAPIADGIDAVVASPVRRTLRVRRDPRRGAGHDGRGRAGVRRDGVRPLGRADLRRGRRARPGRPRRLARLARHAAAGRRVVPRRGGAGAGRARPGARGARRQDRGRGQPRDPDQDPGRPRARRAAGVGVPDGARPGLGDACCRRSTPRRTASAAASLRLYNARPPGRRRLPPAASAW